MIYITLDFIQDLKEAEDVKFVRQVLNHSVCDDGSFRQDKDDHRYDGIEGAWIRYVSRGNTAFRIIYIRQGVNVYLYRAGRHSVEDHLQAPSTLEGVIEVGKFDASITLKGSQPNEKLLLLKSTQAVFLNRYIQSRYHIRHKEIYLVSPFIETALLESRPLLKGHREQST